jgi:hypothetical protein
LDTILVILGNPPYNGYAGIAQIDEERDLTTAYREAVPGLPAPQGQGLNDLYIRFFRIAERRIVGDANVHGNQGGCGIVSFISNNAWLDGLSHVSMRKRYIDTFQSIYIDNLNGDKYRTGKTTPDGKPDPSAFSTPQNREGIQVGTAISTLVRTSATPPRLSGELESSNGRDFTASEKMPMVEREASGHDFSRADNANKMSRALAPEVCSSESPIGNQIHLRDLWGTGKLAQLGRESRHESEPAYSPLTPSHALGNPLASRTYSAAYTTWPRMQEIFPVCFPGVKTSRDPLVVEIDRDRLEARMKQYLDRELSDEEMAANIPCSMESTAQFSAIETRRFLRDRGFQPTKEHRYSIRPWQIIRYAYRPYDLRWLYWEPDTNLLDRGRPEYIRQVIDTRLWIEIRQREASDTFCRGTITRCLSDQFGNGMSHFVPNKVFPERSLYQVAGSEQLNLSEEAHVLVTKRGMKGEDLFFHAIAAMHTPQYRTENAGALLGDWPRIPLPATAEQLAHSAALGRRLAELLDAESSINLTAEWSFLAALKLPLDPNLEEALKLTAGWGHQGQGSTVMPGRGKAPERPWTEAEIEKLSDLAATQSLTREAALALLGESCVDVYLNGNAHWSAVPINVWNYTLGGYQVLKKWLSYREFTPEPASPLLHRALHPDEAAYFAQVVRRIAAILLLGPVLDASYQAILPTATGLSASPAS